MICGMTHTRTHTTDGGEILIFVYVVTIYIVCKSQIVTYLLLGLTVISFLLGIPSFYTPINIYAPLPPSRAIVGIRWGI